MHATLPRPEVNDARRRDYRLGRLQEILAEHDVALAVLVSPVSLRYAVDCREYQGFQSRIPSIYAFVPVEGTVTMHGATMRDYRNVGAYRPPYRLSPFDGGLDLTEHARALARDITDQVAALGLRSGTRRVAVEMLNPSVTQALLQAGIDACDATPLVELARSIKSPDEIACMRHAIAVAEHAMEVMREALVPGIRENELWSILHQVNVAHDGDWIDGRMLASGPRTNPWLREATDRVIEEGDLVAFDTDMIGPFGYCADISRTWRCGDGHPDDRQRDVYRRARDEVWHNVELVRPGLTFAELSQRAFRQPERFIAHRYPCLAHGVGMCDEYPKIYYREDWDRDGYDGVIEADMTLCVESFVGDENGGEGVKLEEMVHVTANGARVMSTYPLEDW